MDRLFFSWSNFKSPSAVEGENGYSVVREDMSLELSSYGQDARVLIEAIRDERGVGDFFVWANDLPIIRKSRIFGLINTLFAYRVIKMVFTRDGKNLVEIEGIDNGSRLTGKASMESVDWESIYSYTEKGMVRMESFSNRLMLSFAELADMSVLIRGLKDSKGTESSECIGEILRIYQLNEDKQCLHIQDEEIRYWSFHDRLFDKKTRSWGDNVIRSGSYRFLPEPPPRIQSEIGSKPTEYHSVNDLVPPHSRRIGSDSADISHEELRVLLDRAFMNIEMESLSGSDKYSAKRVHKPYPSAGGINELSFYVLSANGGEDRVVYTLSEYQPEERALSLCGESVADGYLIADYVKRCWQTTSAPRYILLITGDYGMIGYRYENIAYRLMLLNAGCATMRFYDACKSMGIGCCCAGSGPSDLIKRVLPRGAELTPVIEIGFGRGQ